MQSGNIALAADTLIRFVPVQNFNGSPTATVGALDSSYSQGFTTDSTQVITPDNLTSSTPFSSGRALIANVNAVNDAPVFANLDATVSATERRVRLDSDINATVYDAGLRSRIRPTVTTTECGAGRPHRGAPRRRQRPDSFGFDTATVGFFAVSGSTLIGEETPSRRSAIPAARSRSTPRPWPAASIST